MTVSFQNPEQQLTKFENC